MAAPALIGALKRKGGMLLSEYLATRATRSSGAPFEKGTSLSARFGR